MGGGSTRVRTACGGAGRGRLARVVVRRDHHGGRSVANPGRGEVGASVRGGGGDWSAQRIRGFADGGGRRALRGGQRPSGAKPGRAVVAGSGRVDAVYRGGDAGVRRLVVRRNHASSARVGIPQPAGGRAERSRRPCAMTAGAWSALGLAAWLTACSGAP